LILNEKDSNLSHKGIVHFSEEKDISVGLFVEIIKARQTSIDEK